VPTRNDIDLEPCSTTPYRLAGLLIRENRHKGGHARIDAIGQNRFSATSSIVLGNNAPESN